MMARKQIWLFTWTVLLVANSPLFCLADDQADARAVIDKAIAAVGGKAKLAKFKARTWTETGTYYFEGNSTFHVLSCVAQGPGQYRFEDPNSKQTMILNGDKGWTIRPNGTREMSPGQFGDYLGRHFARFISYRLSVQDKDFTLSPFGELKIDNRDAIGIRVSHKVHPDITLLFDKQTGLLVKSERTSVFPAGKEVNWEEFFADYREVDGVKVPFKIVRKRDGKVDWESEISELKLLEKLDDSVFAQP